MPLVAATAWLDRHQPWLGELLAWLTVGDRALGAAFDVKKAGVAHLTGDPRPGGMRLLALLPSSVLRAIQR